MRFAASLCLLLAVTQANAVRADDFASDLANCAATPISVTEFAVGHGREAAKFVVNHGECVPEVVAGDPLLVGLSGGVSILMAAKKLPTGAQACMDASIGAASREIADKILTVPGLSSLLPSKGEELLKEIAYDPATQATLFDVPGIAVVTGKLECACAISSTGMKAGELKENIKDVLNKTGSCGKVVGKIIGGAYDSAKAAAKAAGDAAKAAYNAAKNAINSVGCALGFGGCSDGGPPFFCVGYKPMRAANVASKDIAAIFPAVFGGDYITREVDRCEKEWQADIAKAVADKAAKEEAERIEKELDKAQGQGAPAALGFAFRWSPKCADEKCKKAIAIFADQYNAEMKDPYTIEKQYGSFGAAKAKLDKKYDDLAKVAVALSIDRRNKALRADLYAPPADRLPAFGCDSFLGRARQSLCKNGEGLKICKKYVIRNAWDMCVLGGSEPRFYAAGAGLIRVLRDSGCVPEASSLRPLETPARGMAVQSRVRAQCFTQLARAKCDRLAKGGSPVSCEGSTRLSLHRGILQISPVEPVQEVPPALAPQPVPPTKRAVPPRVPVTSPTVEKSTLCRFTSGPRRGETQDYAPMDPIPVGSTCHDARGSSGTVVAR
jgi:hypothetical protein